MKEAEWKETVSLIVDISIPLIMVAGFYLAFTQLREIRKTHQENHDWNRRIAAQEALRSYPYSILSADLQEEFDYLNKSDSISIEKIKEAFDRAPNLQKDLHQLLNFYESLARGIHQQIFDEDVVKAARMGAMIRTERAFRNYINRRREISSPNAWSDYTRIVSHWRSEIEPKVILKDKTGGS